MKNLCDLTLLRPCNELSCLGVLSWSGYLHTLQLLCLLSIFSWVPTSWPGSSCKSRKELQIWIGCGSRIIIWDCCLPGTWNFPAESLTVLTCTEPGADGEGKHICRYKCLYRPAWAEEFTVAALDVWSAQGFLDIWRTFPGIWAVYIVRQDRVSGEEQSELY